MFEEELEWINNQFSAYNPKKKILKELDIFVLDNSLRETTVGQLRGHTFENKKKIWDEIQKIGFTNILIESFNHMPRVGEEFIGYLKSQGVSMSDKYAFTEFVELEPDEEANGTNTNFMKIKDDIPWGLKKMKQHGINNVVMELDLAYYGIDYSKFTATKFCDLVTQRIEWIRENLSPDSRIFINLRDISECMKTNPKRLLYFVRFLSLMENHIFGIAYEESGKNHPEQISIWTEAIRKVMKKYGWADGHLLIHVHEQFGTKDVIQMECLASGATGIWAGLCPEGASMGHASSCITLLNLVRIGNEHVLNKFNCKQLRSASRAVTQITTGQPPHPKQIVCGDRAVDVVFGVEHAMLKMQGVQQGIESKDFDLNEFFDEKYNIRMTTLAEPTMILEKLIENFGENQQFTIEIATKMKDQMLSDLRAGKKEEYNSVVGLALLFDKSGGHLTSEMSDMIHKHHQVDPFHNTLIKELHVEWDKWKDGDNDDDALTFDQFYHGFMAPFFGCYRCDETRKGLQCLDFDENGKIGWNEFSVFLKWAAHEYPETSTAEDLLTIAFRKGIAPAMQDEIVRTTKDGAAECASIKYGTEEGFYRRFLPNVEDDFLVDVVVDDDKVVVDREQFQVNKETMKRAKLSQIGKVESLSF